MAQPRSQSSSAGSGPLNERAGHYAAVAALIVLGLSFGLTLRGHFLKPHTDFFEVRETGHALLRGELPASFKRAPLYPLLVAAAGSLLGALFPLEAPDLTAAEWINALLLPTNAVLMYLIGRRWLGGAARWLSVWAIFIPWGLYCTAHAIAEPLLVSTILLALLAAQRGSRLACLAASLASMARYDAAGVIPGLALADLLRRRRPGRVFAAAALASLPLAIWLLLTAATWPQRSADHYLVQMAERPGFDLGWSLAVPLEVLFSPDRIRLPGVLAGGEPLLRRGVWLGLVVLALAGAAGQAWRRDRCVIMGLVSYAGYTLVHAAFPFHEFRFGYPLAPLLLLSAGLGGRLLWERLDGLRRYAGLGWLALAAAGLLVACAVVAEAQALPLVPGVHTGWGTSLTLLAVGGLILVWAASGALRPQGLARLVLLFAMLVLVQLQVRATVPLLGSGREMVNEVQAARWVRDHTSAAERVLAATPGLLRLYAGDRPRGRFVAYRQIRAWRWPAILAECRRRGIKYIIWHDRLFAEHGGYYGAKWGLARFAPLARAQELAGLRVARRYEKHPTLLILRVLPQQ